MIASSNLYEVAVIELPTQKDEKENSALPRLIIPPTAVIARNDRDAAIKVALNNPVISDADPNRLEILVRPFAKSA